MRILPGFRKNRGMVHQYDRRGNNNNVVQIIEGTIRAMSVGSDLFAACVPVCPSMSPETFSILKSVRRPVWVTSAYIDHTLYRHKYLVDAVMCMRDNGNRDAHLTLFSPEDLEKYDIAVTPDLPYTRLFSENHASWIPTYNNEYGIMSWLLNQTKEA